MHVMRCAVSQSLRVSPGNLVFERDMFLDLPLIADLVTIQEKRQLLVNENLRQENARRREWFYEVGQQVLIQTENPAKLEPKFHGPYTITQVFQNGTVNVRRSTHVIEKMNIRRLKPYRRNI